MVKLLQWFLPSDDKFFIMLKRQSANVVDGAELFKEFIDNYEELDEKEREKYVKNIKEHENVGDIITHKLMDNLNKTFITPFDKEDIHNLTVLLDDIIDLITTASLKMDLYKIKKISPEMKKLTDIGFNTIKEVNLITCQLKDIRKIKSSVVKVHTLENEADGVYHKMLGELFNNNKNAVEIMKYKEIYDILEEITDKCEHTMHVFEALVVKHV